jgi:hypothetical protein
MLRRTQRHYLFQCSRRSRSSDLTRQFVSSFIKTFAFKLGYPSTKNLQAPHHYIINKNSLSLLYHFTHIKPFASQTLEQAKAQAAMAVFINATLANSKDSAGKEGWQCTVMTTEQEPRSASTELVNAKDSAGKEGWQCTVM